MEVNNLFSFTQSPLDTIAFKPKHTSIKLVLVLAHITCYLTSPLTTDFFLLPSSFHVKNCYIGPGYIFFPILKLISNFNFIKNSVSPLSCDRTHIHKFWDLGHQCPWKYEQLAYSTGCLFQICALHLGALSLQIEQGHRWFLFGSHRLSFISSTIF